MTEEKKLECVWNMGTDCSDDVEERSFFGSSVKVPVCSEHAKQHNAVMVLHHNKYDVEEVLNQSAEYRKGQAILVYLSGLDDSGIDLELDDEEATSVESNTDDTESEDQPDSDVEP
jgi:hypothetical protein